MKSIIACYLQFTGKEYSTLYKVLSMVPGTIIFLVVSPFIVFKVASFLGAFIPLSVPRPAELIIMTGALCIGLPLMTWALFELWTEGEGTPAPITPTQRLVTSGPYGWGRNPIELGTNIYFLALGILFDSLVTGILCMLFGLALGTLYIKLLEEKEMRTRFGNPYDEYLHNVPFMALPYFGKLKQRKRV